MAAALRPLLIDVGIPVGTYYLLRDAFGVSLWLALALSSIGPAVRAIAGLVGGAEAEPAGRADAGGQPGGHRGQLPDR